ncbi:putative nucleotidyltransferase, ribonuclease H [Tanacetum coccineum]
MGCLTKDCFPVKEYYKLSAKKIGPLEIVEKINTNAYRLKLPSRIRCSDVFNVKHLIPYHGDSSDDDLAMNSRTNFVYPKGNDGGPTNEERADLFLEAPDRMKKRALEDRVMARMEEQFDQFVDQLSDRMDQLMNRLGNHNVRGTDDEQSQNPFGEDDDSSSDEYPMGFIDWLVAVEEVFKFKEVLENKRVSLIATKLCGRVSAWWQQLKLTRERVGKSRITSWQKMKKCMRANFIPYNYQRKEVAEDGEIPEAIIPLLGEFLDVFPDEPHYRMSLREHKELRRQVEELVSNGNVHESMSSCVVPALLTPKKDGTWRIDATIFMMLDLKSGYYQIRLRHSDEWKIVFKIREGLYECASFNEHVTHVRHVLTLLRKDSFYAAIKKCVFMTPKVLFLRYVVSGDGVQVDESKVAVVQEWPTPTTVTEVWSFHGLASFYMRFIPNFSSIMAPLIDCMKGKSFVFELYTDASKVAVGGVLSQGGRPVAYFSEKLTGPKSRHIRTQDKVSYKHGRWLAFLEKFTFVVKHKTSVSNRAVDALSRKSGLLITMQVDVPGLDVIRDMVVVDPYFLVVL